MKVEDYKKKSDVQKLNHPRKTPRKRNKEKLSHDEIEELMGVHRDIYYRKNGAVRRKR